MGWNQSTGCCFDRSTLYSMKLRTIPHVSFPDKELRQDSLVSRRTDASGSIGWARRSKSLGQLSFRRYITQLQWSAHDARLL